MNKKIAEQLQYRRIIVNLTSQKITFDNQKSQFDDKIICNTPLARINQLSKLIIAKKQEEEQINLQLRKQRIKIKLKQNLRQKDISSIPSFNRFEKQSMQSQRKKQEIFFPTKKNSEFFKIKNIHASPTKHEIVSELLQNPFSINDFVKKKSMNIRSRSFKSANNRRQYSSFSKNRWSAPSQQHLNVKHNLQHANDKLQPWRYTEDYNAEQPIFIKKRLTYK